MKNKKQIIASILLGATIISATALVGCGNNSVTPVETNAPAAETNAPAVETTIATQTTATEAKVFAELVLTDAKAGHTWEYKDDSSSISASAGYCTDTDIVYDITFNMQVLSTSSEYASFKTELEGFENKINALNDSNLFCSFKVFCSLKGRNCKFEWRFPLRFKIGKQKFPRYDCNFKYYTIYSRNIQPISDEKPARSTQTQNIRIHIYIKIRA